MASDESSFAATVDCYLNEGLSVLAHAAGKLGALRVSALVIEGPESIRIAYHWPDSHGAEPNEICVGGDLVSSLAVSESTVPAAGAIGEFLNRTGIPANGSFLLVRWPEARVRVVIAFGFAPGQPMCTRLPEEMMATVRLAALTAWMSSEVARLRRDLNVVSDRLGHRKLVERAKGILQAKHGWNEQRAYEHLRRLSRQRRKTLADTARELLRILHGP